MENHTVLFVDDEVNILKALQRLLRNEPIDVLTASTPSEAFELIERAGPQVIVTDQRMPEMSGVDFLASARDRHNDVVRMMLTGYTDMKIAVEEFGIPSTFGEQWWSKYPKADIWHFLDFRYLSGVCQRYH